MKSFLCIVALMLAGLYSPASAELYRYVDGQGTIHYTDDFGKIPVEQRAKSVGYAVPPDIVVLPRAAGAAGQEAQLSGEDREVQDLKEVGKRLQEEYESLIREKDEVRKASETDMPEAEREELRIRTDELNRRIEDHRARKEAFDKRVNSYNARIDQRQSMYEKLVQREADLRQQYETLVQEKQTLDQRVGNELTDEEVTELAEQYKAYNERLEAYNRTKEALGKDVDAFNSAGMGKEDEAISVDLQERGRSPLSTQDPEP